MPDNDDVWLVVETWVRERRIPGVAATRMLRAACTRMLRAYARGKLHDAVARNRDHPHLRDMDDDVLVQYIESAIEALMRQDALRARHGLIEGAVYACLAATTLVEYTDMWLDLEAATMRSPTFQALRDEAQETVNDAFRAARHTARAARMAVVTPAKTACTRKAVTVSPALPKRLF